MRQHAVEPIAERDGTLLGPGDDACELVVDPGVTRHGLDRGYLATGRGQARAGVADRTREARIVVSDDHVFEIASGIEQQPLDEITGQGGMAVGRGGAGG